MIKTREFYRKSIILVAAQRWDHQSGSYHHETERIQVGGPLRWEISFVDMSKYVQVLLWVKSRRQSDVKLLSGSSLFDSSRQRTIGHEFPAIDNNTDRVL